MVCDAVFIYIDSLKTLLPSLGGLFENIHGYSFRIILPCTIPLLFYNLKKKTKLIWPKIK